MSERLHPDDIRLIAAAVNEARNPIDETVQISSSRPWMVDYHNRKHIFLWLPSTALTLSFEDYGSGPVQAQIWINVAMPQGTKVTAVGQSTNTSIMLRYTDEVIP